ncbi:MAG: hypothetical protein E4H01_14230 [Lysobacterales bacterium]|nr:MAG: hypothetical protein E4H01_14230 [Xanthomonadales bacterium]
MHSAIADMHDLVIKNARICDGLGSTIVPGDLAVKDGRISALGDDVGRAREVVDADGLVLAPGIVDTHTHYDAQITWDPSLKPSPALGVTTVVMGNCGFAIAPCRPADRELTCAIWCVSKVCRWMPCTKGYSGASKPSPSTWI